LFKALHTLKVYIGISKSLCRCVQFQGCRRHSAD
jgi:hypothetical protein